MMQPTLLNPRRKRTNDRGRKIKGAKSLIRNIEKHLAKIEADPNSTSVGHWLTEIAVFRKNLEKILRQLDMDREELDAHS